MDRLVKFIAPRGWLDGLWKGAILLVLVILCNYIINGPLRGYEVNIGSFIFDTSAVAAPFLTLAMALLHHQRRLQQQLLVLASTDTLTGLPNRRAFMDGARAQLLTDARDLTVLMIDADHFKRINDAHGHGIGDLCLQVIATHLRASLPHTDLIGRIGGEEFAALVVGTPTKLSDDLGSRLSCDIHMAAPGPQIIAMTISIGLAQVRPDQTLEQAMTNADKALYLAKMRGRARLEVWSSATVDHARPVGDRRAS